MLFTLLTLLTALGLAAVAGWFSIIGVMAIYAGAPIHALIAGVMIEAGKLVTTSWLYRNWDHATWLLKAPLIFFTVVVMLATSMGVFGFLSKAHLEQGAATINNTPKIERLEQQIAREKSRIEQNNKIIAQLDATLDSYIGKDRADRSVQIRQRQEPQRKQIRAENAEANKLIDQYSDEKFKLSAEVRQMQLEVGPIRYIAELIYGAGNTDANIEAAVRMFSLLLVSTLDPLAVVLLIAANHSIMRRRNEKEIKKNKDSGKDSKEIPSPDPRNDDKEVIEEDLKVDKVGLGLRPVDFFGNNELRTKAAIYEEVPKEVSPILNEEEATQIQETNRSSSPENVPIGPSVDEKTLHGTDQTIQEGGLPTVVTEKPEEVASPAPARVNTKGSWTLDPQLLTELVGNRHFVPAKIEDVDKEVKRVEKDRYPKILSWLKEFKGTKHG